MAGTAAVLGGGVLRPAAATAAHDDLADAFAGERGDGQGAHRAGADDRLDPSAGEPTQVGSAATRDRFSSRVPEASRTSASILLCMGLFSIF